MTDFTDQTILVTGGGTGIGRATCLLFAKQGANVVVNYSKSKDDAEQTASDVRELGRKAIAVQASVADESAVRSMFARTMEEFGRLDILVNNAGTTHIVPYTELDDLTESKWDDILGVNVKGTFFCSREAIAAMKTNGGGHIVNVTSIAGITGRGSSIAYAASKAALNNMTKAMALTFAPEVRVNAVAPGVVMTRWVKGWEHYTDAHKEETPMKRVAQPEDVAKAIYALACNEFITGEIMTVDGGRLLNV